MTITTRNWETRDLSVVGCQQSVVCSRTWQLATGNGQRGVLAHEPIHRRAAEADAEKKREILGVCLGDHGGLAVFPFLCLQPRFQFLKDVRGLGGPLWMFTISI
jgi:hypothetical protein